MKIKNIWSLSYANKKRKCNIISWIEKGHKIIIIEIKDKINKEKQNKKLSSSLSLSFSKNIWVWRGFSKSTLNIKISLIILFPQIWVSRDFSWMGMGIVAGSEA